MQPIDDFIDYESLDGSVGVEVMRLTNEKWNLKPGEYDSELLSKVWGLTVTVPRLGDPFAAEFRMPRWTGKLERGLLACEAGAIDDPLSIDLQRGDLAGGLKPELTFLFSELRTPYRMSVLQSHSPVGPEKPGLQVSIATSGSSGLDPNQIAKRLTRSWPIL